MSMRNFLLIIVLVFISTKSFSNPLYLKCTVQKGQIKGSKVYFKIVNKEEVYFRSSSKWYNWCQKKPSDVFKILDDGFSCNTKEKGKNGLINEMILDVFLKEYTVHLKTEDYSINFRTEYKCEIMK